MRAMASICFAGLLILSESACGGGRHTATLSPALSISTTSLADGMARFPYSETIWATGGDAPFVWSVSSGMLPHNVMLTSSSDSSVAISGTPDTAQSATFTIQVKDSKNQNAAQAYTINIAPTGSVQLQTIPGQVPAGVAEIRGVAAGPFSLTSWQQNTLNWVPDVRMPMLASLTSGPWQNIYAPWALEQSTGWRMFYGGWDGTATSNDRIYSVTTPDFLTFNNRTLVIDHGDFLHVNNANVSQLSDGSMHMICTTGVDNVIPGVANSKGAYFSSPDGITWNGTPEPYPARISDLVTAIANDPNYPGWDFNGGNVLLRDGNAWVLYYSVGIYGGIGQVYRAVSSSLPALKKTGVALNTPHYSNDVKKFTAGGKAWYLMALYVERVTPDPNPPMFTFSLSNDGISFGPEQSLFAGASDSDKFIQTPSFVTRGNSVLGVVYGANPNDLLSATSQIFSRWLQKKVLITDSTGAQVSIKGAYGPDRQWVQAPASGPLMGNIAVYAEDGITPLGRGTVDLAGAQSYTLLLN
jgi:putative Ig domain-containing protein